MLINLEAPASIGRPSSDAGLAMLPLLFSDPAGALGQLVHEHGPLVLLEVGPVQALLVTANDIDAAFPDLRDDTRFTAASSAMRAATDKAIANPPLTCDGLGATMKSIGETCKACHQDFRG